MIIRKTESIPTYVEKNKSSFKPKSWLRIEEGNQ